MNKKDINAVPIIAAVLVLLGCTSVIVFGNSVTFTIKVIFVGVGSLCLLLFAPLVWVYLADRRDEKRAGISESDRIDAYLRKNLHMDELSREKRQD